jgi:hypothetical protein
VGGRLRQCRHCAEAAPLRPPFEPERRQRPVLSPPTRTEPQPKPL